jgi:hypothetical protein
MDFFISHAGGARGCGYVAGGVEEHLPLALVEEEAEGGVSAESGCEEGEGEGGEEPAGADVGFGFGVGVMGPAASSRAGPWFRFRTHGAGTFERKGQVVENLTLQ